MNGYECDGTDIFMRLNRKFNLSPNENICTLARMKD